MTAPYRPDAHDRIFDDIRNGVPADATRVSSIPRQRHTVREKVVDVSRQAAGGIREGVLGLLSLPSVALRALAGIPTMEPPPRGVGSLPARQTPQRSGAQVLASTRPARAVERQLGRAVTHVQRVAGPAKTEEGRWARLAGLLTASSIPGGPGVVRAFRRAGLNQAKRNLAAELGAQLDAEAVVGAARRSPSQSGAKLLKDLLDRPVLESSPPILNQAEYHTGRGLVPFDDHGNFYNFLDAELSAQGRGFLGMPLPPPTRIPEARWLPNPELPPPTFGAWGNTIRFATTVDASSLGKITTEPSLALYFNQLMGLPHASEAALRTWNLPLRPKP